jgi:hypothetical protein
VFDDEPDWQPVGNSDIDCDDDLDTVDSLTLQRFVAELDVRQTQPCPDIGKSAEHVFGDIDCDDDVDPVDALFILRYVAGLPVNLPRGCLVVGP